MKIFPELSKNAWIILLTLSYNSGTAAQIARESSLRLNRISEALDKLEEFKIIKDRGRKQQLSLDSTMKITLSKLLVGNSRDNLAESLEGKRLNVLFQILESYDTVKKLNLITGYSVPTIKRILNSFQRDLLVYQPKKSIYKIRDEFLPKIKELYSSFFACFVERLQGQKITWKRILAFGNRVLLKSAQSELPDFVHTAFSLFHRYGIGLILTSDNYFVNKTEVTREEVFVHALVFSINDERYMLYCKLFADLNKLTLKKLKNFPAIFRVEKEVTSIFEFLSKKPLPQEYIELRRDYERG